MKRTPAPQMLLESLARQMCVESGFPDESLITLDVPAIGPMGSHYLAANSYPAWRLYVPLAETAFAWFEHRLAHIVDEQDRDARRAKKRGRKPPNGTPKQDS